MNKENLIAIKHKSHKYFRDIVRIQWNIGKRCNYDCSYCPPNLHDHSSKHIDIKYFQSAMKNLSEFYRNKKLRISLTGGEPFVHPRILNILSMFREYPEVEELSTITNGSLSVQKYEKTIKFLDLLIFSWHLEYARSEHMKNVLSSINKIRKNNQHIFIHIMFLPGHLDKIKEITSWLKANDIKFILRRIRPLYSPNGGFNLPGQSGMKGVHIPNFKKGETIESYYSEDEHEYLQSFEKSGTNRDNVILYTLPERESTVEKNVKFITQSDNVNTLLQKRINTFFGWQCRAGIETLYIENDGNVFRASCKQGGSVGNIFTGFSLDYKPITCRKSWCNCSDDLNTTKWKKGYSQVIGISEC